MRHRRCKALGQNIFRNPHPGRAPRAADLFDYRVLLWCCRRDAPDVVDDRGERGQCFRRLRPELGEIRRPGVGGTWSRLGFGPGSRFGADLRAHCAGRSGHW